MSAVVTSLIAVAGTLLGSLSTYLFQRRTVLRTEESARRERLRQDRLLACGEYAAAVTEVKRAVVTAWFRRETRDAEWRAAMTEADRHGATAEGALIRVLLLVDDQGVRSRADALFDQIGPLRTAPDKAGLETEEAVFAARRLEFVAAVRAVVG